MGIMMLDCALLSGIERVEKCTVDGGGISYVFANLTDRRLL